MDIISLLVIAIFVAILFSLGSALFHLTRQDDSKKMARALTVRIALSIGLFVLLMLAWWAGIISPHGLTATH